jgi:DNA-binding transcriptional LysR family regulator
MDRVYLMSTFVSVVDNRSFAGAARELGLSPPAVTRAIAELEELLRVQLLTRTTRVVRPTDAGSAYVEDCRRILADIDEADAAATGMHAAPRGHLTVTAPVLFGRLHVAAIVTEYLRRHAEVTASCWFVDRVVNLVDEGVDVAVRIGHLPDSSLRARKVGQVRQVVCAAPAYLDARAPITQPEQLADHVIVSASAVTPGAEWRFAADEQKRSVRVVPRVTANTNDAAIAMVLDGFGLTRLMSYQAAPYLHDGRLRTVLEAYEPAPLPVHLVHREGRRASMKVRAFVDLAAGLLAASPAIA